LTDGGNDLKKTPGRAVPKTGMRVSAACNPLSPRRDGKKNKTIPALSKDKGGKKSGKAGGE